MKKQILFAVIAFWITAVGFSQKDLISAASFDINAGYVGEGAGIMVSFNYHLDRWSYLEGTAFGAYALNISDGGNEVPYNVYTFQLGYFRRLWEQYTFKKYAIYAGAGAAISHEIINDGRREIINGEEINGVSQPIYGPYLGLAGELRLRGNLLVLVKAYSYFHLNSEAGVFYPYVGAGVRYFVF